MIKEILSFRFDVLDVWLVCLFVCTVDNVADSSRKHIYLHACSGCVVFFFKMLFGILFHYAGILFPKALINTFGAVSTFLSPQKSPEESSSRETW